MTVLPTQPAGSGGPAYQSTKSGADSNSVTLSAHDPQIQDGAKDSAAPAPSADSATVAQQDPVSATQTPSILESADAVLSQIVSPASVSLDAERSAEKARLSTLDVQTQSSLAALAQSSNLPNDILDLLAPQSP